MIHNITQSNKIFSAKMSSDQRYLALSSFNKTTRVIDLTTGDTIRTIKNNNFVYSFAFSPDSKMLVTGSNYYARVTDVVTGKTIKTIKHSNKVQSVAFSPDGKYLSTASIDQTVLVIDLANGKTVRNIKHNSA